MRLRYIAIIWLGLAACKTPRPTASSSSPVTLLTRGPAWAALWLSTLFPRGVKWSPAQRDSIVRAALKPIY